MLCMNIFPVSNHPLWINKLIISKDNFPRLHPKPPILRSSKPYYVDAIDENVVITTEKTLPLPPHVKIITSTSNPFVKHCIKLRQCSSYRHSHSSVLLVGSTPIRELCSFQGTMQHDPATIECLLVLDNADVPRDFDNHSFRLVNVSPVVMKKLSGLQSTDCVDMAAVVRISNIFHYVGENVLEEDGHSWFPVPQRIVVLEGIQDPGNLGTLLRSALAFRWDGVFLLSGCCDPFNEKALRASRGACFQLHIVSGEWDHLAALRKEYGMRMLAGHPASSGQLKPISPLSHVFADSLANTPLCLVLGNEGSGLSDRSMQECDLVSIPMTGNFESLNVSVAGGIFLYMLQPEKDNILQNGLFIC